MLRATERLSFARLATLPTGVTSPRYDPSRLACGIVHLGIGAFHRAHQAFYTDTALNQSGPETAWGIVGASLRGRGVGERLHAQDCLYSIVQKSEAGAHFRVIGSVRDVVFAPDDPTRLPRLIADPAIRIVSLTVTEKGYRSEEHTSELQSRFG